MKTLYVVFDAHCGLCVRTARWLRDAPSYFPVVPIPHQSTEAAARFPSLATAAPDQVIAVADTGEVYRGDSAWLMCLYALRQWRPWAIRLAQPSMRPLAHRAIAILSSHRKDLSHLLGAKTDPDIARATAITNGCRQGMCAAT